MMGNQIGLLYHSGASRIWYVWHSFVFCLSLFSPIDDSYYNDNLLYAANDQTCNKRTLTRVGSFAWCLFWVKLQKLESQDADGRYPELQVLPCKAKCKLYILFKFINNSYLSMKYRQRRRPRSASVVRVLKCKTRGHSVNAQFSYFTYLTQRCNLTWTHNVSWSKFCILV